MGIFSNIARNPEQMFPRSRFAQLAPVAIFFFVCILTWGAWSHDVVPERFSQAFSGEEEFPLQTSLGLNPDIDISQDPSRLLDIQNSTLGFQKIYVLSMPSRTDKRDALTLAAFMSGLEIEYVDGPNGSLISHKAAPDSFDPNGEPGTLGCWRGHMDVYEKMVRDRVQTAFIMEDDSDWDVMIKAQMTEFARGTRHLQKSTGKTRSPYGDGWDFLVTGHCGMQNFDWMEQQYWVTENDPTVLPDSQRTFWRKPNLSASPLKGKFSRFVMSPHKYTCTGSYAVSLAGAARIIYDQQVLPNGAAIDMALSTFCRRRSATNPFGCMAAYPTITGIYRPAGSRSKESDRKELSEDQIREVPLAQNLVYSVRLNLWGLLNGQTLVKAQFPEDSLLKDVDAASLRIPLGGPVYVKPEEYTKKEEEAPPEDEVVSGPKGGDVAPEVGLDVGNSTEVVS